MFGTLKLVEAARSNGITEFVTISSDTPEIITIGTGEDVTIRELAEMMGRLTALKASGLQYGEAEAGRHAAETAGWIAHPRVRMEGEHSSGSRAAGHLTVVSESRNKVSGKAYLCGSEVKSATGSNGVCQMSYSTGFPECIFAARFSWAR